MALFHTKNGFLDAADKGDIKLLKEYLAIKDTNWCEVKEKKTDNSALYKAVRSGHLAAVTMLVEYYNSRNGWAYDDGMDSLTKAVVPGREAIFDLLLAQEAVLKNGARFPISTAISHNQLDLIRKMVATGKVDLAKTTPPAIYHAVTSNKPQAIELLLELGASPNVSYVRRERWDDRQAFISVYDSSDYESMSPASPLFAAARLNETDIARQLVQAGAQVAAIELPLLCAAQNGNIELAKLLLESKNVEINAVSHVGRSALHFAAENNKPEMVRFLLEHGANPGIADKKGVTATTLAQQFCLKDVYDLMRSYVPGQAAAVAKAAPAAAAAATPPAPASVAAPGPASVSSKPPAPEEDDAGERWTLSGKIVLAHTLELPEINRRLTEIFNFANRERLIITENFSLRSETMSVAESFDAISEDSLTRAFGQYKRLGGVEDEASVFRNRRAKLTVKPAGS